MSQETTYIYDIRQLEDHLVSMRARLFQQKKLATIPANKAFIQEKIEQINAVLSLKYFRSPHNTRREELIIAVKDDRNAFKSALERIQKSIDLEGLKEKYKNFPESLGDSDEAMLENYEEMERYNAFRSVEKEHDGYKHEVDVRWWLLGMLHRPYGYFSKAWNWN